ncbi:MAG: PHP domain-containing protein [Candidatus Omnitrophica bacterium]|nr:PHP domain-containing protein [Candidatus Omnitrophota bacterium]
MKCADLHIHSSFSDGNFMPEQIIREAKIQKLDCIAITDHDNVEFYFNSDISKNKEIEIIPAVELTTEYNSREIHILGYLIDYHDRAFLKKLEFLREKRILRIKEMIGKLNALGIEVKFEEVVDLNHNSSVTRLHLARLLLKKGLVGSIREAFVKFIGEDAPCYVGGFHFSPLEAIRLIREIKGLPVLAHPYSVDNLEEILVYLTKGGLAGIEVYYPEHNQVSTHYYEEIAQKYNLLMTGGSDFHGDCRSHIKIGSIRISYDLVLKLKGKVC